MGGYVSIIALQSLRPDGLLLMAPAIGLADYPEPLPKPNARDVITIHGWRDEVVPVANVFKWAQLYNTQLVLVADDNSIHAELNTVSQQLMALIARVKISQVN